MNKFFFECVLQSNNDYAASASLFKALMGADLKNLSKQVVLTEKEEYLEMSDRCLDNIRKKDEDFMGVRELDPIRSNTTYSVEYLQEDRFEAEG